MSANVERDERYGLGFLGGACGVICVLALLGIRVVSPPERILVVVVPGTYGNDRFWPNVDDGKVTFGSELLRAIGSDGEVYPFLWASSIHHPNRQQAAANLASVIERKAKGFDRVCLVGHGHGGNVALLAASDCRRTIDMVVCLSTPHVYLRTVDTRANNLLLPVYCSPRTLRNVRSIVCIAPKTDAVPDAVTNLTLTGLAENEAIR